MSIINEISSKFNYNKHFLFNSSEITLKFDKVGINNIIDKYYLDNYYPYPSSIYLNNIIQTITNCTQIRITEPGSIVRLVWDNPLQSIRCLFCLCSNITEIKFLNFNTSLLTDMVNLFAGCTSLTSVDLSKLNTKNVFSVRYMFEDCFSIEFINLSNFDTSNVVDMSSMFHNCKNLTSIDLSNFNTSKVTNMKQLFYNCTNLEYINLLNFTDNGNPSLTNMFDGIAKNAVICIDKNKGPSIFAEANNMSCVAISCNKEWKTVQYKLNETGDCIINCNETDYRYKDNGKCYDICDSNCKTCNVEENMPNTNCLSCYENKYLNNGKCVDNDENGYYSYNIASSIKIDKSDIIKCEECSSETLYSNNLFIPCNIEQGYYPLLNDTNNIFDFHKCYTGNITGYYFDNNDKYYKPCYNTCNTCNSS